MYQGARRQRGNSRRAFGQQTDTAARRCFVGEHSYSGRAGRSGGMYACVCVCMCVCTVACRCFVGEHSYSGRAGRSGGMYACVCERERLLYDAMLTIQCFVKLLMCMHHACFKTVGSPACVYASHTYTHKSMHAYLDLSKASQSQEQFAYVRLYAQVNRRLVSDSKIH
jgi:hypothetical protein